MNAVLVDTGFWFAYFLKSDLNYPAAQRKARYLQTSRIVVPWPTLYEAVNTRFVKQKGVLGQFERILKDPTNIVLDDTPYRLGAWDETFSPVNTNRALSLVDSILRLMLADVNLQVAGLITFNAGDLHDVCRRRRIEIL